MTIFFHDVGLSDIAHLSAFMKFPSPLIPGTLIKRYRRFLADVQLADGSIVTAHCPNSGTMVGCSQPGRPVLLTDSKDIRRRNPMTWELTDMDGTLVGVNTGVPRKLLRENLDGRVIPTLEEYDGIEEDALYGRNNKIDFMLFGQEQNVFIDVFHVAWVEKRIALFPERASLSAKKSFADLTDIAKQGHRAVAFFVVQREDCDTLKAADEVDKDFLKALLTAHSAGVEIQVYRAHIRPDEITLGVSIPYSLT